MTQKRVYGLDFGTTNSVVAIRTGDEVEVLPIGMGGSKTVRSVLYFPEDGKRYYVGEEAVVKYVEDGMQGRFLQSVKSLFSDPQFRGTIIRWFGYQEVQSLAGKIIRHVKERADQVVGDDVTSVVIGRPAEFSENPEQDKIAQDRLVAAVREAGFTDIRLQLEPIAAALHYEETLDREQLVFVADLGGGTSDFTIMRLSPERRNCTDRKPDVLANGGVYIGGDRFDSQIMAHKLFGYFGEGSTFTTLNKTFPFPFHLLAKLRKWQLIPFLKDSHTRQIIRELLQTSSDVGAIRRLQALIEENLGFALFRSIEKAKVGLSETKVEEILFRASDISIREIITRTEFDVIIGEEIREFDKCINRVIGRAGVQQGEIQAVFVTGGTSLVPRVRDFLATKFGKDKIRTGNTFTSVAAGLALS